MKSPHYRFDHEEDDVEDPAGRNQRIDRDIMPAGDNPPTYAAAAPDRMGAAGNAFIFANAQQKTYGSRDSMPAPSAPMADANDMPPPAYDPSIEHDLEAAPPNRTLSKPPPMVKRQSSHFFVASAVVYEGDHTPDLRRGFIRKVYGILTTQLLLTVLISALFMFNEPARTFAVEHRLAIVLGTFIPLIVIIVRACFKLMLFADRVVVEVSGTPIVHY